ncbi:MAG: type II secretion system protein [Bacteroidales bacterium]|nr:type II secretion system protein [Bacteroidales bacterium]
MSKQLRAFTMSEMMVVLAITATVFLMAVFIITNFNSYFRKMTKENDLYTEIAQFNNLIEMQMFRSDSVLIRNDTLVFKSFNKTESFLNQADSIWLFSVGNDVDTFRIKSSDYEIKYVGNNSRLVSSIRIKAQISTKEHLDLIFFKQYDNYTYFKVTEKL